MMWISTEFVLYK